MRVCLYRQADKGGQLDEHSSYAAIEALEHHWDKLSKKRKEQFADMAVVTRCVTSICSDTPCLHLGRMSRRLMLMHVQEPCLCLLLPSPLGVLAMYDSGAVVSRVTW